MSAQDLSFAELGDVTRAWTLEPVFTFLNTHPVSAPFMEEFLELRTLVTSARAEDSALAEITDELGRVDADHDEAVRFIVSFLVSFTHYDDPVVAAVARSILAKLIPEGLALVRMSYADEAGRFEYRESLLTPEMRSEIASFPLPHGRTLIEKVDELQGYASELGTLLERRRRLAAQMDAPTGRDLLNARRALIAMIQQIFRSFAMLHGRLDAEAQTQVRELETSWLTAVREATDRAERRRANRKKKAATGSDENDPANG